MALFKNKSYFGVKNMIYYCIDPGILASVASRSSIDISNKPNLCAPPQTITRAIGPSRPLPSVCDSPPGPHCRYRGHHANCFHKGSRGMSCVSDFLASRPSSGSLGSAEVWDGARRRSSSAENSDTRRIFRGVKHEAGVGETKARVHSTKYWKRDFRGAEFPQWFNVFLDSKSDSVTLSSTLGVFEALALPLPPPNIPVNCCCANAKDRVHTTLR